MFAAICLLGVAATRLGDLPITGNAAINGQSRKGAGLRDNYLGAHGAIDNHLDIDARTRRECVEKVTNGDGSVRGELSGGAACHDAADNAEDCAKVYEAKYRGDHRPGEHRPGADHAFSMVGEVHLCEWVDILGSCEAGAVVTVCPEWSEAEPYVVEVELREAFGERCFGCEAGRTAYKVIEANFGDGSVESPDHSTGTACGHGAKHIRCGKYNSPDEVFIFELHEHLDCEVVRNRAGRQRNEIKVYDKSDDSLKGFYNTTMRYSWKFYVDPAMLVSPKFTHIFQLKFVGGDTSQPAVTFTVVNSSSGIPTFQVRNSSSTDKGIGYLAKKVPWADVTGVWVTATVEATLMALGSGGHLRVELVNADTGAHIVDVDAPAGLWRDGLRDGSSFLRPKWGIYRSDEDKGVELDLNNATVAFSDFCISRVA